MASDHYFSSEPQAEEKSYPIEFEVAGRTIRALGASGTFSANKLDAGTRVLLNLHANFPSQGRVLDLGCGWGPISLALASQSPELEVLAVDVNQRSLAQTAENAASLGLTNVSTSLESDMSDGQIFDQIWSNSCPSVISESRDVEMLVSPREAAFASVWAKERWLTSTANTSSSGD